MKALLLPILPFTALTMLTCAGVAQETTRTKVKIETRSDGNLYRAIPRGNTGDANKQRYRVAYYKPTQHYYTRDNVISYRYTAQMTSTGGVEADGYLGPHGAVFVPEGEAVPASASVRSFASVTRRTQPGVGMAAAATVVTTTKKTTRTTEGK